VIKVFLSYAREDTEAAERLYRELNSYPRVEVWYDKRSLAAGKDWAATIRKALRSCRYCIVLLSRHSVTKRGFYQREIRLALDVLKEFPEDETFLVPMRLDDCDVRFEALRALQYIDLFPDWWEGFDRLLSALQIHISPPTDAGHELLRVTSHQARFQRSPRMFYFVNIANKTRYPLEITHVWYEDPTCHIQIEPLSRSLPVRLKARQPWCTWLPVDAIPERWQDNSYDRFRVRLSTGEVIGSQKEETVPPVGPVPGGPIDSRDL
jgi:hypothetical protein